jgi:hypothetical protein
MDASQSTRDCITRGILRGRSGSAAQKTPASKMRARLLGDMRLILCAALLLLAGCTSPAAPDLASETVQVADEVDREARGASPPLAGPAMVVVRLNTSFDAYTGVWDVGVQGAPAASWDAAADLGLPRPMGSLLFEMRCQQTGGTAYDHPGYRLRFEVEGADGTTVITQAAGNMGDCVETKTYHRDASPRPSGKLVVAEFEAVASLLNHEASYDVQFAITWFDAGEIPAGYSAFA